MSKRRGEEALKQNFPFWLDFCFKAKLFALLYECTALSDALITAPIPFVGPFVAMQNKTHAVASIPTMHTNVPALCTMWCTAIHCNYHSKAPYSTVEGKTKCGNSVLWCAAVLKKK